VTLWAGRVGTGLAPQVWAFLLADDSEMYERNQRGVQARTPEWLQIKRGMHRERLDENGHTIGYATDEVPLRGIWRHYRQLMTEERPA